MSQHIDKIALGYLKQADANPAQAGAVYREAAQTLAGYATDPENAPIASTLLGWALRFVSAADRPATVLDFDDLLRETAEAYRQVGSPYDDMAPIARYGEIHEARTPGLPRVSITPKSVSRSTRLGDQVTIAWVPTEQQKQAGIRQSSPVLQWQGAKEESQALTVDTAILDQPKDRNPDGGPRPFVVLTYGTDGAKVDVKMDVGQRATVAASMVTIAVGMNPPPSDFPKGEVTIGATMGFFAAPSLAPVFLTEFFDDLGPGMSTELMPRPVKSSFLLPMQSSLLGGTARLEFYPLNGISPIYVFNWVNSANTIAIPLAADVAFYRVVNTGGGAANFRLPFQLTL